ncbi:MAG: M15 family metallopeptidase [Stenotrophomonas sp.]|uniref:M15 family metallopeptidase n=1 Tax=Stenotrophomonas sp. TaxID=69392 RepID=UPI003D6C8C64
MLVIVIAAVLIFLLLALVCWWLLFPASMNRLVDAVQRVTVGVRGHIGDAGDRAEQRMSRAKNGVQREIGAAGGTIRRHWPILTLSIALLTVPPAIIFMMRQTVVLADFQGEDHSTSGTMVAQLLRGERLRPPPPPPPEAFTTAEVRKLKPEIVTADRRWEQIDPDLQQRVLAIYEVMRRQYGYEMVLVEGYRSPERQAELMAAGKATRAGAWQSCHQYGLGVDSAPIRNGKLQWNMEDPWTQRGYYLYGELAQQAGLEWGGSWRSIKDFVHVEMRDRCRAARTAKRAELAR